MSLPLTGLTVLEFTHAVMGPTCGLLLADMGAEVIHIEPPKGDHTRRLRGFGTGFFDMYGRNKKSLAIDLKSEAGQQAIYELAKTADVVVENFGPGTIDRLGFGYEKLKTINPRLIFCSLKGFLTGPYEKRHAMDEVVQMMGGLAYMTGRPGDPLRAGTSVVDITGGMFGYIGILQALYEREKTGLGKFVKASLFETCVFLVGQHMAYSALLGPDQCIPPMPARISPWSVYRTFATQDGQMVFIGIVSDKHWDRFCAAFGWEDWRTDPRLKENNMRIDERDWLLPELEARLAKLTRAEIIESAGQADIPFSPIAQPEDLFQDPHLLAANALMDIKMKDGITAPLPKLPIEYGDAEMTKRHDPPVVGEHTAEVLARVGVTQEQLAALAAAGVVTVS